MHNIQIEKIPEREKGVASMMAQMEKAADAIRRRAFDHFLQRGGDPGGHLNDWLRAERELMWAPPVEVIENDKEVVLRVQAPGLEPGNIQVTATPNSILIQADVAHRHEESNGKVCFCEFAERLVRRIDLPAGIDVNKVSASLEKGILRIAAVKAQSAEKSRPISVATSASTAA